MAKKQSAEAVATNRQAAYRYFIGEKFEAGIVLEGPEVKSLRDRRVSLNESFCRIFNNEAWIVGMHITPWAHAGRELDPTRTRKLLLKRTEIKRLVGLSRQKGHTLIPLKLYFNKRGMAKIEIALCQGKHQYDKREAIKKKLHEREMARARKRKGKV